MGDPAAVIAHAAWAAGVTVRDLRSTSRVRSITRVRKIAVLCGHTYLGRPLSAIASLLGISPEAERQLEKSAKAQHHEAARSLATSLRTQNNLKT